MGASVWRRLPAARRTWVVSSVLLCCAVLGWAQTVSSNEPVDLPPPAAPAVWAEDVRRGLQKLSKQMGELKTISTQSGRAQLGQGDSLKQQVAGIEKNQRQLNAQLGALEEHSLRQLEALQVTNHRLVVALWMLAGALALITLLAWRWRPNARAAQPAATQTTEAPVTHGSASAAGADSPAFHQHAGADAAVSVDTSVAPPLLLSPAPLLPSLPLAPAPAGPSALSALVAADLLSTQQAIAQAQLSFSQPVQIPS